MEVGVDEDGVIVIDNPECEQIVLDLAEEWGVSHGEILVLVLTEALEARDKNLATR